MSGRRRDPIKVKIIMTQFIQTDAQSFKSVVQNLTGRDSGHSTASPTKTQPLLVEETFDNGGMKAVVTKQEPSIGEGYFQSKEMEMFLELPTFDEFLGFCCD